MLCAAIAPLLMAGAPEPVRLQPSSPWDVDYGENSCRLMRIFGEGQDKTSLLFESPAPDHMTMLVVGQPLRTGLREVSAKFIPANGEPMTGRLAESSQERAPAILWSGVDLEPDSIVKRQHEERRYEKEHKYVRPPPFDLVQRAADRAARQAFASSVTGIQIDVRHDKSVVLETGPLGDAIKIFDVCMRDALKDWGVNPDVEDKIVRPVWAPEPWRWLVGEDYPDDMIMRGQESEVSARLLVDAAGKPTSCTSLSYFREPEFNKTVCTKLMARAKFWPAELADGTRVASYYTVHVIFNVGH